LLWRRVDVLTQQLYAGDNTILAKGKSANAMVTRGTERPRAVVTLNGGGILYVISANHFVYYPCRLPISFLLIRKIVSTS